MPSIKIITVPPGFAPDDMRAAWVGVTIPILSEADAARVEKSSPIFGSNAGGYFVRGEDAVKALKMAGKDAAARYWSNPLPPPHLQFARDCCELVE